MATKVILDVDTGTDDALALMLAALSSDIELVAATTVSGNLPVEICTENTLRVLDYIGAQVSVYEGLAAPLIRSDSKHVDDIHGTYLNVPAATSKKQDQSAVDFLIETYMASDGDIVLAPVAPLTNIAAMLRQEPRVVAKIPEMVIMGGGHLVGNMTPSAEFNIWFDPEAARIVLSSGIPMRIIPLDATHRALLTLEQVGRFKELGTPAATATAIFTEKLERFHKEQFLVPKGTAPMHDSLVICAILDPSVVTTHHCHVDVEISGELTYGRTVFDLHQRSGQPPNCHVALDADNDKYGQIVMELLSLTL